MPKATGGPICSTTEVIFTPSWFYKELQCWKHMLFRDWSIAVQSSENSYFPEAIYNPFLASDFSFHLVPMLKIFTVSKPLHAKV